LHVYSKCERSSGDATSKMDSPGFSITFADIFCGVFGVVLLLRPLWNNRALCKIDKRQVTNDAWPRTD
jgi:hypothetical protein